MVSKAAHALENTGEYALNSLPRQQQGSIFFCHSLRACTRVSEGIHSGPCESDCGTVEAQNGR